ncbi:hypothetical protein CDL12_23503 [Handroanthus impetiginosus]|uniref:Uncharacterized protein n=1 Tax=Handroanthus impetiginosus TaxID=429701 RepID=A0A2G9GFK0_9LAMI|nr:hypothetical protein CDL12_23503 [Handroanthus impetiginosus]
MESFPDESFSLSYWDYFTFLLLRPILAVLFTFSLLSLGWFLAWKLVLVHVPLVQEIFGLRKKPVKPKPAGRRRFTQFYKRINAEDPSLECHRGCNKTIHKKQWPKRGRIMMHTLRLVAYALQECVGLTASKKQSKTNYSFVLKFHSLYISFYTI